MLCKLPNGDWIDPTNIYRIYLRNDNAQLFTVAVWFDLKQGGVRHESYFSAEAEARAFMEEIARCANIARINRWREDGHTVTYDPFGQLVQVADAVYRSTEEK